MKNVLKQKQTTHTKMTADLTQAIRLLQYPTHKLYDFIKEQAADNPLIELEERMAPQPIHGTTSPFPVAAAQELSMRETLTQQAKLSFSDAKDRQLALTIIENLNDDGYLKSAFQLEAINIERGIHLLQQIGPSGIGARDLKECLSLQLAYEYPGETLAHAITENHLELLALRKWEEIAKILSAPLDKVKKAADLIKTLDPKPGSALSNFQAQYVMPDIIVKIDGSKISYYLNDRYLPSIRLNPDYAHFEAADSEAAAYLKEKSKQFEWLVKSIEQRRMTILKIMDVIIKKQEDFFRKGFIALKPLTLKDVAAKIGMHESTVSRATMNKVIQTPAGSFDLRLLFSAKLENAEGIAISQSAVKVLLKNCIDAEDKCKPLSDQKIAGLLSKEQGIPIARRTIAKYREQLNIPAASKRKS